MPFDASLKHAQSLDQADPLVPFRSRFAIPTRRSIAGAGGASPSGTADGGEPATYLVGNSLGLMPRAARDAVMRELDDWERLGVEGHLHGTHPWLPYHEDFRRLYAPLVGAKESEVVAMNGLTVNLHVVMTSFYRPSGERSKIIIEDAAFPSDQYSVRSQAALKGFHPNDSLIRLRPRDGETTLRTEDIIETIRREGPRVALVMLGAVNYLTGQWFDMDAITRAGREAGAVVGWDLAHAIGNVPLMLSELGGTLSVPLAPATPGSAGVQVMPSRGCDFAVWCSYKYLNGGPGAVAGAYINERHHARRDVAQLAGWWGNDPRTRFKMEAGFVPVFNADRWALSNPPVLSLAPLRPSLELFREAGGIGALREKSLRLTGYLESALDAMNERLGPDASGRVAVQIITPRDPAQRGCQLSLRLRAGKAGIPGRLAMLKAAGVALDFREPDIARAAPVPLYNTFADCWRFVNELEATYAAEAWTR